MKVKIVQDSEGWRLQNGKNRRTWKEIAQWLKKRMRKRKGEV